MSVSHLQSIMNAQDYLQSKLTQLQTPLGYVQIIDQEKNIIEITRLLLTKKFRKYSASEELIHSVKQAVRINVEAGDPINVTFLNGAYKLWRLDESPEADWAELFSCMHFTSWVKPVCEIYKPGVVFDFFMDDLIVPILNNVPIEDVHTYIDSCHKILNFLQEYQPDNLQMTINTVGDQFESEEAFNESLHKNIQTYTASNDGKLPELNDKQKAMVELNTKATSEQKKDPLWREKVMNTHNAYSMTKAEARYHKRRPEKILAFTQSLPAAIGVGSTKDSVAKFWVGVGALKPRDKELRQVVLSPNQLESAQFDWQDVSIEGLSGKNFSKIRLLR